MKPIVGITMGDPSGNGPEISIKALLDPKIYERCNPLVIGDAVCLKEAVRAVKAEGEIQINPVERIEDAKFNHGFVDVLDMRQVEISRRLFRKDRRKLAENMCEAELAKAYEQSERMCGEAAFQYVKKVIELAMEGKVDATVTNALNKDHINLAGHHYSGHTEI